MACGPVLSNQPAQTGCDTVTASETERHRRSGRYYGMWGQNESPQQGEDSAKLYTPVGTAGPCGTAKVTQMPQLLAQARADARKPLNMMMVNCGNRDQAAPLLPPVTLPSLHTACCPTVNISGEAMHTCVHLHRVTWRVIHPSACLQWRTMSAQPVETPWVNISTNNISCIFVCS